MIVKDKVLNALYLNPLHLEYLRMKYKKAPGPDHSESRALSCPGIKLMSLRSGCSGQRIVRQSPSGVADPHNLRRSCGHW